MTNQEILTLYKISMVNQRFNDPGKATYNDKSFLGGDNMGGFFDLLHNDPDVIDEDILSKVNAVLNGDNSPLNDIDDYFGGTGNYAVLYSDAVRFHDPNTGQIVQTVPLADFKIIAQAWRDFLLQPPLIG